MLWQSATFWLRGVPSKVPRFGKISLFGHQSHPERFGRGPGVIYVTNKLRNVPDSGGARRDFELLKRLVNRFDVHFVAVTPDFTEEEGNVGQTGIDFASETIVAAGRDYAQANDPLRIANHASTVALDVIRDTAFQFDVSLIHVNGYFLMPHICLRLTQPIVLQEENIEWKLERDRARLSAGLDPGVNHAIYGKEIEMAAWRRATHCIAVAEEDADHIRGYIPTSRVHCIPNGVDPVNCGSDETGPGDQDQPYALFVGNYGWPPSRDAAEYIGSKLWPAVRAIHPNAKIKIAGSGADDQLIEKLMHSPGVDFIGRYTSFAELLSQNTVFLSAIRFGGGNKMKIAEALSFGLPTVATPESLRGFSTQARNAIIICDDTQSLAENTAKLLLSDDFRNAQSHAMKTAASALPDWDTTAQTVAKIWHSETNSTNISYNDTIETDARSTKKGMQ